MRKISPLAFLVSLQKLEYLTEVKSVSQDLVGTVEHQLPQDSVAADARRSIGSVISSCSARAAPEITVG